MMFRLIFKLTFFLCLNLFSNDQNNIYVRVLLDELDGKNNNIWNIKSTNGLIVRTKEEKKKYQSIEIKAIKQNFFINNEKLKSNLFRIDPIENNLKFNDKEFQGCFYILTQNNKLLLINKVELEDYIYCVLHTESWPGWPLEVNKAFAIASRSYVIAKYLENKEKTKRHYHVKNTNKHQTYYGTHKRLSLRKAVNETKGIVIGYNKKPILAMFDACCGGIIPADIQDINFEKAPYLKRKECCLFCKCCKIFNWSAKYLSNNFLKILQNELPKLKSIQDTNLIKDKAGTVQTVNIKDKQKKRFTLSGKKFYSLFDEIKSFSFSIKTKDKQIEVNGVGYGHHIGLCQWGAKGMVDAGWDYKSILKFYYPDTQLMKLTKKHNNPSN